MCMYWRRSCKATECIDLSLFCMCAALLYSYTGCLFVCCTVRSAVHWENFAKIFASFLYFLKINKKNYTIWYIYFTKYLLFIQFKLIQTRNRLPMCHLYFQIESRCLPVNKNKFSFYSMYLKNFETTYIFSSVCFHHLPINGRSPRNFRSRGNYVSILLSIIQCTLIQSFIKIDPVVWDQNHYKQKSNY